MKKCSLKNLLGKNSKAVKVLSLILCALLICTALSLFVVGIVRTAKTDKPQSGQTEIITISEITYRAVLDGVVVYVDEDFYLSNGYYPELYKDGTKVHIDDLKDCIAVKASEDIAFYGWYMDSKCTVPFENDSAYIGDFVIFAKLITRHWTRPY